MNSRTSKRCGHLSRAEVGGGQLSVDFACPWTVGGRCRWTLSIVGGHCQLSVDIEFDLSQLSPGQPVTHVSSGRKDQNRDCKYRAKLK